MRPLVPVQITTAHSDELPVVMGIIDEAARWVLSRGIQQWESPPPAQCWVSFARLIQEGCIYLVRLPAVEQPIGTFRLEWNPGPLWPDERPAGYLYSLALRPDYTGQGIGYSVIEWAKRHVSDQGRRSLRLDCISSNRRLRKWYRELGFQYRGRRQLGTYLLARFELEL